MGSKMRSLGLSSLVVTSLDKGAHDELTMNGWDVPKNSTMRSIPQPFVGLSTVTPSLKLLQAVEICNMKPKKDKIDVPYVFSTHAGVVKKQSNSGWRRRWGRRFLTLGKDSLSLFKTETSKLPYKSVPISTIYRIEQNKNTEHDDGYIFSISFKNRGGRESNENETTVWCFSVTSEQERDEWISLIATRALVDEIAYGSAATKNSRVHHFISECGSDLEYQVVDNVPLILFAIWRNRKDVVTSLLKKGVNACCLLRLDPRTRPILSTVDLVELLEITGRDLNLIGDDDVIGKQQNIPVEDDEGGWSLLHHFVARRDVVNVERLLQRIDRPTLNFRTLGGETAFSLAVRKLCILDDTEEGGRRIAEIVKLLLDHGADPNLRCDSGDTPFHIVCKRGTALPPQVCIEMERCALLDINLPDAYGDAPIHILLKLSEMTVSRRLINDPRFDPNKRDCNGDPTLILAMKMKEESFACLVLSKNADGAAKGDGIKPEARHLRALLNDRDTRLMENSPNEYHDYPIHLAITMRMPSLALKLVETLSIENLIALNEHGRTALHLAILHSLLGVAHAIVVRLDKSPFLSLKDRITGDTALHLAIRAGRVELSNALLDAGAPIAQMNHMGETCIHVCARFVERTYSGSGAYSALKLFTRVIELDSQGSPALSCINTPTYATDQVPDHLRSAAYRSFRGSRACSGAQPVIHQAVSCENEQCGLWLLEALLKSSFISLESLDAAGCTPLCVAIESRNAEICKLLISKCSVKRLVGLNEESYLHLAVKQIGLQNRNAESLIPVIESLLAHGAYAGFWDREGNTPLHIACCRSQFESTVDALLRDKDVVAHRLNDRSEYTGLTPLLLAVKFSRSPRIVEMLLNARADYHLVEPGTRFGVFQLCLQNGFDDHTENEQICVQLLQFISESSLSYQSAELKARQRLAEKYATQLEAAMLLEHERRERNSSATEDSLRAHPTFLLLQENEEGLDKGDNGVIAQKRKLSIPENETNAEEIHKKNCENDNNALEESEDDDNDSQDEKSDEGITGEFYKAKPSLEDRFKRFDSYDRLLEFERFRSEALETAEAWLDSESGKVMVAQMASVIITENEEGMPMEAAIELARRNYIEKHVREHVASLRKKLLSSPSRSDSDGRDSPLCDDEHEPL